MKKLGEYVVGGVGGRDLQMRASSLLTRNMMDKCAGDS